MAKETKMIIITSNEDLIRQFSLKNPTNTLIIDLDNEKQTSSKRKNNDEIIDLALLAQLSEPNSSNDQVYKRILDSPDNYRSKPVKQQKKSLDLICTICGDHAIGFNYDALSCASCKAFFRRNAQHSREQLRCLTGNGQCSIRYDMRRKCQRCRLDRCFAMGMRKDFILSEEEKEQRRKRIEENRNMASKSLSTTESTDSQSSSSNILSNSTSSSQTFNDIDLLIMDMEKETKNLSKNSNINSNFIDETSWTIIENIRSSFLACVEDYNVQCSSIDLSDRVSALISWSHVASEIALRFINFFRQIDEFENLSGDDRFILIKYNLFSIFPVVKCYKYKPMQNHCLSDATIECEKRQHLFLLSSVPDEIRNAFIDRLVSLVEITEQDPAILSLLLSILIFSQGLSMNENEPPLNDSLAVHRAQIYYTELLWRYWLNKYGEIQTYKKFTRLFMIILRIQLTAKTFREFFRSQFTLSNTIDKVAPLMQSVLHIV